MLTASAVSAIWATPLLLRPTHSTPAIANDTMWCPMIDMFDSSLR
jgi:hypothetical protein